MHALIENNVITALRVAPSGGTLALAVALPIIGRRLRS